MFNLSKDQSLRSLLSKVELDEETSLLVKQDASPTEIKNSLLKNMNSSNIVKYRRYIKKAEDEEFRYMEEDSKELTQEREEKEEEERQKEEDERFLDEVGATDEDRSAKPKEDLSEFDERQKRQG